LTRDGGADEKSQNDGDPEIDGDARAFHVIVIKRK
jgi:hypothetical protein